MTDQLTCPCCRTPLDASPSGGAGWCVECDRPVLIARGDGNVLDVWCPHCLRDHHHGRHNSNTGCRYKITGYPPCTCPPGSGDGHRVAHCGDPESPYYDTGYIAVEAQR